LGGKHKLTALQVRNARTPGRFGDGAGLYLAVTPAQGSTAEKNPESVNRSWLFIFTAPDGRRREMGLGSVDIVSLADARDLAEAARKLLTGGVDPIEARKAARAEAAFNRQRVLTFREAAEAYVKANKSKWTNEKHAGQWTATLETYAYPKLGKLGVGAVDVGAVLSVLEPIWSEKPETASRLRGRIEQVLTWATVRGYRQGENPARWRGHLSEVLPERGKVRKVQHHAALPVAELPAFMAALRKQEGMGALALEFAILTAARTGEVIGAPWAEIDLEAKVWTVPAERMKGGREHRVPLSTQALAVLDKVRPLSGKGWIFPSPNKRKHLSNMAMLATLKRMGRADLTAHGFRSTFRDWAGDLTGFPREVAEAALAHVVGDAAEQAYRRGDALQKRSKLMQAWADYADRPASGAVVSMKRQRGGGDK
jgi:integrase